MTRSWRLLIAVLACLSLVAAACGGDDDDDEITGLDALTLDPTDDTLDLDTNDTTAPATGGTGGTGGVSDAVLADLDANGDGVLSLAVATPGPRDDGAYYQALVTAVEDYATAAGWPTPRIEDNIPADDARPRIEALAQESPDVIFLGASEIADPLPDLAEQYSDIFWYCSCGAGFESSDWYAQSQDNGAEISFSAGFAAGLLLMEQKAENPDAGTVTAFIGGAGYPFETESLLAYELGIKTATAEAPDAGAYTVEYIQAGNFDDYLPNPDNPDVIGAKAAYEQATAGGDVGAVYPYLGGAHLPVVHDANAAGYIVMSAGSSTACEEPPTFTDPETNEELTVSYDMEVRFDGGDYLGVILDELFSGELLEGDVRYFAVGVPETVTNAAGVEEEVLLNGGEICDPTAAQEVEMTRMFERVASGEFDEQFGAIQGEAYSGG